MRLLEERVQLLPIGGQHSSVDLSFALDDEETHERIRWKMPLSAWAKVSDNHYGTQRMKLETGD